MIFISFFLLTFIACTLRLHFYFGGDKLSFIDRLLVTDSRILFILFFTISLAFIYTFSSLAIYFGLDLSVLPSDDISWLDDNKPDVKIGENANVNINGGNINVSFDRRMAAAVSAGAGAGAGIQVAKYVAGPPAVKIAAGVTTAVGVQAITTVMNKVLASNNQNSTKLVANLELAPQSSSGGNVLDDYPLNLLYEVNTLLICAMVFLYIILNIYISKYIISKDLVKYIPTSIQNNKIGKFFILWLNKYLNLWSKSSNYLLGYCYIVLFIFLGVCKFALYLILSA